MSPLCDAIKVLKKTLALDGRVVRTKRFSSVFAFSPDSLSVAPSRVIPRQARSCERARAVSREYHGSVSDARTRERVSGSEASAPDIFSILRDSRESYAKIRISSISSATNIISKPCIARVSLSMFQNNVPENKNNFLTSD